MPHQPASIDDLLEQTVALGASDLHLTVGSPPVARVRGHLQPIEGHDPLSPEDTQQLVYRILSSEQQKRLELGLPASLHELTTKPRGLVLVTGPTGSGKSTTLAALIDEINRTRSDHILTIEDPVEFVHRHKRCIVNQREIGVDAISFGAGLRAALRQDPDVILVGEMRDLETIGTALTAAETGH